MEISAAPSILIRAIVLTADSGSAIVDRGEGEPVICDLLYGDSTAVPCSPGDTVLVMLEASGTGVVLGRIGPGTTQASTPDELVLEARSSLTLRVGDGSITIQEDGKILIKGTNLVSHATRRNRIRGGSVEIN